MSTESNVVFFATLGEILGYSSIIGFLLGFSLGSKALSPLIAGVILGSTTPALFLTLMIFIRLLDEEDGKKYNLKIFAQVAACTATSGLIGAGIAACANAILPGVMLVQESSALIGTIIGAVAPLVGFIATFLIIIPLAEKVNEYIISPTIERFSSKEKEYEPSLPCSC